MINASRLDRVSAAAVERAVAEWHAADDAQHDWLAANVDPARVNALHRCYWASVSDADLAELHGGSVTREWLAGAFGGPPQPDDCAVAVEVCKSIPAEVWQRCKDAWSALVALTGGERDAYAALFGGDDGYTDAADSIR